MNQLELELLVRCARDPWFFMTECIKTRERTRGATPFPRWEFLRQTVAAFQRERMVVILKSRQMMVSWTTAAFLLWECLCVGDADQIIISKREEEAREMLNRIRLETTI